MKFTKRILSLLLAVVMVVTMLNSSLVSLASITVINDPVSAAIVVPELIYKTPGADTFQYYIAGVLDGEAPSTTAETQGSVAIYTSRPAESISISAEGAATLEITSTYAENTNALLATITSGSMEGSGSITWTINYVVEGIAYESVARTYVYQPYLGQVGAQYGYEYVEGGNEPVLNTYSFVTGIHSVTGGAYDTAFVGTEGLTMSPLIPGWGDPYVPKAPGRAIDSSYFPYNEDYLGGVASYGAERASSRNVYYGNYDTVGIINVDSSRYVPGSSIGNIPNLKGGFMIFYADDSSSRHTMNVFGSENAGDNNIYFIPYNIEYEEDGGSYGYGPYTPTGVIANESFKYNLIAFYSFRRSNAKKVDFYQSFSLQVNLVDKAELRATIRSVEKINPQAFEVTAESFAEYREKLLTAYEVLGNPTVSADEVGVATRRLSRAFAALDKTDYKATVYHKLPASDGFVYTYEGVQYTAKNGYVTIPETTAFESGQSVLCEINDFYGYTYTGEVTSYTFTNCYKDVSYTFTYEPLTSTVYFDYGKDHDGYMYENEVTQITAYYGSSYNNLAAPKVDGWRFLGWYDADGNAVHNSTYCTLVNDSLYLTTKWTCNFAGGHGSEADPFLVATSAQFDSLDDSSVFYKVVDGSVSKGKFFKQTASFDYGLNKTPITSFAGNYDGQNFTVNILDGTVLSGTSYASVFGLVSSAKVANLNINVAGEFMTTGTGTTYAGTFGCIDSSIINNVQVTTSVENKNSVSYSGLFAGAVNGTSSITNSSVTVNGGANCNDAFIGKTLSGANLTSTNNWVLVNDKTAGVEGATGANIMFARENVDAELDFVEGRYIFITTPADGWNVEYRKADDTVVSAGSTYSPLASVSDAEYYICATKNVTISAGANGTLEGAGSYVLREGQTVEGLVPNAAAGYTFSGWTNTTNGTISDVAPYTFTMGTTAGSVVATFGTSVYTIVYNANAGTSQVVVPATASHKASEVVTIGTAGARPGYTFKEWNTSADGTGMAYLPLQQYNALTNEDGATVTLYAIWTPIYYNVTFRENGGTAVNDAVNLTYGASIVFPTSTKTGYKNLVWNSDANFTGSAHLPGTQKQIYDNATFYAKWTPITYTISFIAEGATNVPAPISVQYDSGSFTVPVSYIPEKSGFVFKEWNTAAGGNGTAYKALDVIPGNLTAVDGDNITLYAIWETADFTITWNITAGATINGSTTNPTTTAAFGGKYDIPSAVPVKDGFVFKGWFTQANGGTQITADSIVTVTANTSYYAQWNPATYYVSYDANGGEGVTAKSTHTYGTASALNANAFTRSGFTFSGWAVTKDGAAIYADGASVINLISTHGATVTLYAVWTAKKFSVTYNLNGASGALLPTSVTLLGNAVNLRSYNNTNVVIGDSTYEFCGWAYTKAQADAMSVAYANGASFTLTEEVLDKATVNLELSTPTVTLYAVWARYTTVTWDLAGGTLNGADNVTTKVLNGKNYVLPEGTPTKSGFAFVGWYSAEGTPVTNDTAVLTNEDTTVYAQWEISIVEEEIELVAGEDSTTVIDGEAKVIYGLKEGITVEELNEVYLDVIGNGRLEYEYESGIGTGTVVKLIDDATGEVLDTFTLVIFGDLNGDGYINSSDRIIMNSYITGSADVSFDDIFVYAANLCNDEDINSTDMVQIKSILTGASTYDQTSRELV